MRCLCQGVEFLSRNDINMMFADAINEVLWIVGIAWNTGVTALEQANHSLACNVFSACREVLYLSLR